MKAIITAKSRTKPTPQKNKIALSSPSPKVNFGQKLNPIKHANPEQLEGALTKNPSALTTSQHNKIETPSKNQVKLPPLKTMTN